MSKSDVKQQKLEQHVLLPTEETTFKDWWETLGDDDDVDVKYPHGQHNTGKTSNREKTEDLLKFVDNNCTPNGRAEGSHCATYNFLPQFRRLEGPKKDEKNSDEKASVSVTCEFNRAQ